MKYALERIDKHIESLLNKESFTTEEETVAAGIDAVAIELAKVRTYLSRCSTEYTKEKALELLIQQYQAELIQLLDKAYSYGNDNVICAQVMKLLEGMLTHIERRYTKYFNLEVKVPLVYLQVTQEEAGLQFKKLHKAAWLKKIDADLLQLTLDPLQLFSKNKWGASITYRGMLYIKVLLNELLQTESPGKGDYTEADLIFLLTYLNFNTPEMIRQITVVILLQINSLHDTGAREEKLEYWRKELNQCQVKPGLAAISNYASVKDQLVIWIAEELQYFTKRQQRLFVETKWQPTRQNTTEFTTMNLPVPCLGILVRAATEEGLIMNESVDGAIEKACRIFTTPGTKNKGVSSESMRIKSYSPSKQEKARVIEPLYGIIRRISKY